MRDPLRGAILGLVGAGGLGFEIQLSFQTLRYPEIWSLLYALILLSGAVDLWSSAVRARLVAPRASPAAARPRRDRILTGSLAGAAALIPLSAWAIGLDASMLAAERTWNLVGQVLDDAWPPAVAAGGLPGLLQLCAVTLAMSVLATALASCWGMLLAFPAAGSRARTDGGRTAGSGCCWPWSPAARSSCCVRSPRRCGRCCSCSSCSRASSPGRWHWGSTPWACSGG